MAEAQKRTEKRVEELAQAQKVTEERVDALAVAVTRLEPKVEDLVGEMKVIKQALAGLAHAVGYRLEDEAIKSLPSLLSADHAVQLEGPLIRDFFEMSPKKYIELNIWGRCLQRGERVEIIGEAKSQLKKKRRGLFSPDAQIPRVVHTESHLSRHRHVSEVSPGEAVRPGKRHTPVFFLPIVAPAVCLRRPVSRLDTLSELRPERKGMLILLLGTSVGMRRAPG